MTWLISLSQKKKKKLMKQTIQYNKILIEGVNINLAT